MSTADYKKLAGPSPQSNLIGTATLYLSGDHLLLITRNLFAEHCRRLYFKDIQGIMTRRGNARKIHIYTSLACTILLLIVAALLWGILPGFSYFLVGACVIPFLVILTTVIKGPTCSCQIFTAVNRIELDPLKRVRMAEKVLAQIVPIIEAAQQNLEPPTTAPAMDPVLPRTTIPSLPNAEPSIRRMIDVPGSTTKPWINGTFGLILLKAALETKYLFFYNLGTLLLIIVISLCALLGSIILLAKRRYYKTWAQASAWIAMAYILGGFFVGYVSMIYIAIQSQNAAGQNSMDLWYAYASFDPQSLTLTTVLWVISILAGIAVGLPLLLFSDRAVKTKIPVNKK